MTTTQSYSDFVKSRFKTFPTLAETLLHAAIGMCGEIGELIHAEMKALDSDDWSNYQEEIGDILFYYEAFCLYAPAQECLSSPNLGTGLIGEVTILLDQMKKAWVYGKPIEQLSYAETIGNIGFLLDLTCKETLGRTVEAVQKANIEKLLLRYPTGYSDADALARKDKEGVEE